MAAGLSTPIPQSGELHLDGQNRYYQVVVHSTRHGDVFAWLPDEFAMSLQQNWQFIIGGGMPAIVNFMSSAGFGRTLMTQYLTAQVWCGSSPLKFTLPLRFVANRDSETEVINPIKQLLKMSLPEAEGSGAFLIPPGPRIESKYVNQLRDNLGISPNAMGNNIGGDEISLFIGSYIQIPKIFITDVSLSFKGKLNQSGEPMESSCSIHCSTLYSPIAKDIDQWLGPGIGSRGRPAPPGAV
jgi:hypothetical protein